MNMVVEYQQIWTLVVEFEMAQLERREGFGDFGKAKSSNRDQATKSIFKEISDSTMLKTQSQNADLR